MTKEKPVVKSNSFCIVGIGESAGDLDAMQVLYDNIPNHTGMIFIIVWHFRKFYKGVLVAIITAFYKEFLAILQSICAEGYEFELVSKPQCEQLKNVVNCILNQLS